MALKMTFCADTTTKYKGCHFEQIDAAAAHASVNLDFNTDTALVTNEKTAARTHAMAVERTTLSFALESEVALMHCKRYVAFKRVCKQAHKTVVVAKAAKM